MLRKINIIKVLFLITALFFSAESHAASRKNVCVSANGDITIKTKCSKNEKLFSAVMLNQSIASSPGAAGPTGAPGVQGAPGTTGVVGAAGSVGQAGPQGAQGIGGTKGSAGKLDFAACRFTAQGYNTNFSNSANPILYVEVFCNENTEFLLHEESYVNFFPTTVGTKVALQGRSTYTKNIGGDTREYGVGIYANRFLSVGTGVFEFLVRGVCCPR